MLNKDNENILIIDSTTGSPIKKNTIKDFDISLLLGKGSYAKVVLAKNIYTNKLYALKVIDKSFLAKVRKYHIIFIKFLIQKMKLSKYP